MARGLAGHADDVHVVLDRVAGRFLGRLEQRADVDVEAEVGERGGDHLGAAVVAVLAHLHDEHARPAALGSRRTRRPRARTRCEVLVALVRAAVHAGDAYGSRRGAARTPPRARRRSRRPSPGRGWPRSQSSSRLPSPRAPSVRRSSASRHAALVARRRARARGARSAARAPRCCRRRGCRPPAPRRGGTC